MTVRSLLDVTDLAPDEVRSVLDLARRPIDSLGRPLEGLGAALVFEKPSNRTRHSMEMAVVQLGGHPVYTRGEEVGLDRREPVEDVARIMSGYHGLIAARVNSHDVVERLAAAATVPVVNMLSDRSHPLQALADAMTMEDGLGDLAGRTVAYVGDYNNVARSLAEISSALGMHVRLGCPVGYDADDREVARLGALGAPSVVQVSDPRMAVVGAHAVHTDTWVSMGQEDDKDERRQAFVGYTVDDEMMALADPSALFMHCLPAYRGFEVAASVIDGPQSVVVQQGHNRMHSARGLLAFLAGVR
ncbi:MAG: ornithine carbamoyltransferase [Ilumatobacteraceae bacterium]